MGSAGKNATTNFAQQSKECYEALSIERKQELARESEEGSHTFQRMTEKGVTKTVRGITKKLQHMVDNCFCTNAVNMIIYCSTHNLKSLDTVDLLLLLRERICRLSAPQLLTSVLPLLFLITYVPLL